MRYKRRGVDTDGHVANYVETEQLIHVHNHTLSFVQTRGSVPVFWSQAGYRYNPRPRLEKGQDNIILHAEIFKVFFFFKLIILGHNTVKTNLEICI